VQSNKKNSNKKLYGGLIRIPKDVSLALEEIAKAEYRSIPGQLEKILREDSQILSGLSNKKKVKDTKNSETLKKSRLMRLPLDIINTIDIIAKSNIRTVPARKK